MFLFTSSSANIEQRLLDDESGRPGVASRDQRAAGRGGNRAASPGRGTQSTAVLATTAAATCDAPWWQQRAAAAAGCAPPHDVHELAVTASTTSGHYLSLSRGFQLFSRHFGSGSDNLKIIRQEVVKDTARGDV